MNKGIVKFFNESKGYGFIKDEASNQEIFVHVTGLEEKVRENDKVSFNLVEGKKGMNAVKVKPDPFPGCKAFSRKFCTVPEWTIVFCFVNLINILSVIRVAFFAGLYVSVKCSSRHYRINPAVCI